MTLDVLGLLAGFVALYFGAEWLVTGATRIALKLRVSKALVGLTLVAFGTSAPELVVNVILGLKGETDIALANVSGSNLANLCIGFGLAALVARPFAMSWMKYGRDLVFLCATPLLVVALLASSDWESVPFWATAVFGAGLFAYIRSVRKAHGVGIPDVDDAAATKGGMVLFLLGCAGLWIGGKLVVDRGSALGEALGIPHDVLGLTVIALGTSIPDISATVIAARKGETDIAVGNILGSNIFNVLFVLPATLLAARQALPCLPITALDYGMGFVLAGMLAVVAAARGRLPVSVAAVFILTYVGYIGARIATL